MRGAGATWLVRLALGHVVHLHPGVAFDCAYLIEQEAVEKDKVENMTITVGTQRRAVLEAIAFGAFLRDVETHVDLEYRLLTPVSSAGGGPFGGRDGNGGGGGSGGGGNQPVRR